LGCDISVHQSRTFHQAILKRGTKRLHERLAAAMHILFPQLRTVRAGRVIKEEGLFPSVNNMSILVADILGWKPESQSTVKAKVWKPTRPVAHLAAAWLWWRDSWEKFERDPDADHFMEFFFEPAFVREAIGLSEEVRSMLPEITQFKITDDELVVFEI
jgi:hypothetical protein